MLLYNARMRTKTANDNAVGLGLHASKKLSSAKPSYQPSRRDDRCDSDNIDEILRQHSKNSDKLLVDSVVDDSDQVEVVCSNKNALRPDS